MNQIQWYKVRNGKVFHAFEWPAREHTALCGSNAFPMYICKFPAILPQLERDAASVLNDENIRIFAKHKFCKNCWKKLDELRDEEGKIRGQVS